MGVREREPDREHDPDRGDARDREPGGRRRHVNHAFDRSRARTKPTCPKCGAECAVVDGGGNVAIWDCEQCSLVSSDTSARTLLRDAILGD